MLDAVLRVANVLSEDFWLLIVLLLHLHWFNFLQRHDGLSCELAAPLVGISRAAFEVILGLDRVEAVAIVGTSPLDVVHLFAYDAFQCAQFLDHLIDLELFLHVFVSIKQVLVFLVSLEAAAYATLLRVHLQFEEQAAVLLHFVSAMDRS